MHSDYRLFNRRTCVSGGFDYALFDAGLDARSLLASTGSGIDGHVDVFDDRRWSFHDPSSEVTVDDTVDFTKSSCASYTYGVSGIGLNASFCAEGRTGFEMNAATTLAQGPGPQPFDEATRRGGIDNELKPFAAFSVIATATVDALLARGGMRGTVDVVTYELPIVSDIDWGEVDGPAVIATWNLSTDLVLTFLAGHIDAFADLARPGWCDCGTWCAYPCRRWSNIVNERLVSFSGISETIPLLSASNTRGATLTD